MEWQDLEKMTVVKLREEAQSQGIEGVHGKNKADLVEAIAGKLGIEPPQEELSSDTVQTKGELKNQIQKLKIERDRLIEAHDSKGLKKVRREIHGLKRRIKRLHSTAA
jgi:hypothetical protein